MSEFDWEDDFFWEDDDDDLNTILGLASEQDPRDAGKRFTQAVINHCIGIGYLAGVHPSVICAVGLAEIAPALERSMSDADWRHTQMRIADLLELRAHHR